MTKPRLIADSANDNSIDGARLADDSIPNAEVYWLSASDINTVVNGGVAAPVLFNGTSFGQLTNDSVTTRIANMVIPPTNAGWLEIRITSTGTNASVVDEIGVGNFKVWDALCADCAPLVTSY